MWPAHTTHDPVWCGTDRFRAIKGYSFREYTLSPDGTKVFEETFNGHVAAQKKNHLVNQERAKYLGKAKTKHCD